MNVNSMNGIAQSFGLSINSLTDKVKTDLSKDGKAFTNALAGLNAAVATNDPAQIGIAQQVLDEVKTRISVRSSIFKIINDLIREIIGKLGR